MRGGPAAACRSRLDIGDIVRAHRRALEAQQPLSWAQRRLLWDIERCRTAALGGHIELCPKCGLQKSHFHSCRNRHCPKCQGLAQERWIAARCKRLLPIGHFHVVFTLPSSLRALAKYRRRELFGALFAAASQTLLELGRSRLEAQLGVTMVLHTWTRELRFHPHVHAIVTAGGLALDAAHWRSSSKKYLFDVKQVLSPVFRGKMTAALRALHQRGRFDGFAPFRDPERFESLMAQLARSDWVVYAKKPFRQSEHVVAYLGRYTHRVAISNSRLVNVTDQAVTFRTKDGNTVTLGPVEFLCRFVQHVLPERFHKIRHYGLYAGSCAQTGGALERARRLLAAPASTTTEHDEDGVVISWTELLRELTGRDVRRCPGCGAMLKRRFVQPGSRAPPQRLAA